MGITVSNPDIDTDDDLSAIAALDTKPYGRSLLTLNDSTQLAAEVGGPFQPLDARLTAIVATGIALSMFATSVIDIDGTLAANSDSRLATQKAVKTYADTKQTAATRLSDIVATGITLSMFATNVADTDPTLAANSSTRVATQAAIKSYVDNAITGVFWKPAVDVATTANITLSGEQTIDGVLTSGSRVLVKNQSTASQNGLYLSAAGAWSRVSDADTGVELWGSTVMVKRGTVAANTQWTNTNTALPTVGSTSITYAQISGAGTYSATGGVILTGNQFSADTGTSGHKLPWLDGANVWSDTQTLRKAGGGFQFLIDNGANTKQMASWFSSSDDQWNLQPRSAGSLVGSKALAYNFTDGLWSLYGSPIMTRGATETITGIKTFGDGTAIHGLRLNGSASGTAGGGFIGVRNSGTDIIYMGNYSSLIGGAYNNKGTIYSPNGLCLPAFGAGTLVTDAVGNVSVSSDVELKRIRRIFRRGLADMLKMDDPVTFNWRKLSGMDTREEYSGFTAQGVRKGIPEAVGKDPRGMLTLQDRPILATHHNAIIELNAELKKLRREVTALRKAA